MRIAVYFITAVLFIYPIPSYSETEISTVSGTDSAAAIKLLKPGTRAPTFSMRAISGELIPLRLYCGDTLAKPSVNPTRNTVVLSFWATYCVPCAIEIPILHRFAQKHAADPIQVLLVSIDQQGAEIVVPFAQKYDYSLPILLDPYKKTATRYGVTALPSLFIIDTLGIIRFSSFGYEKESNLEKRLDSIVAEIRFGKRKSAKPVVPPKSRKKASGSATRSTGAKKAVAPQPASK